MLDWIKLAVGLIGLAKSDPIHYNGFKDGVPGSETVISH